jgi:NTP pyrophosphatase (non-canonical NTP hydrolase)
MTENVLNQYQDFVNAVTSDASKDKDAFLNRINELYDSNVDVARLLTAGIGLSSESGEFLEIVKKVFFHEKPFSEENILKLKLELGDCLWYWINACKALSIDPYEVIAQNVKKLEARYPGGKFEIIRSEVRQEGDI